MNRRELLAGISRVVSILPVLACAKAELGPAAQGALEAPWEVCPVCGVDQTDKAWHAGVQNVGGYCQAVCWGCRAETVSPWPCRDSPEAAEEELLKAVESAFTRGSDLT